MSAPQYVPAEPLQPMRAYRSNPWRPEPWEPDRPAELEGWQPDEELFGNPGPDHGYTLLLASRFEDRLVLADREKPGDVLAGAAAIANRRSALFGRGPMLHDLTLALTVFGYLSEAPGELVEMRGALFSEVSFHLHYQERRKLAAMVPEWVLRSSHQRVAALAERDWRLLFQPEDPEPTSGRSPAAPPAA